MSAKFTVADFVQQLCQRADYGIRGEKPLAIIAALKYLYENKITGKSLLELLTSSHVKRNFIELAKQYSSISEPSSSWEVITGTNRELQNAIIKAVYVNEAFSKLRLEEIKSLLEIYIQRLAKSKKLGY